MGGSPLNQLTQVDPQIRGATFAINLIAHPPEPVRTVLSTIQDTLERRIPGNVLFRCPLHSLHLSVFQFVWARHGDARAEALWTTCCDRVLSHLARIANSTQAFPLRSPSIHAGQSAIIVKFSTSDALEALREQVLAVARETDLSWNRPVIQHVSIFRYT